MVKQWRGSSLIVVVVVVVVVTLLRPNRNMSVYLKLFSSRINNESSLWNKKFVVVFEENVGKGR